SGFTLSTLAFLLVKGAWDQAGVWTSLTDAQRAAHKTRLNNAGIKIIVSAFGATDTPTSSGTNPVDLANNFAAFVKKYNLDGIDVDYEDFDAFNRGTAEAWIISFTRQLRVQLPAPTYIISHAPVAPWFVPNRWPGGGYLGIDKAVGSAIDWYNIQFYNQGQNEYTTCNNLLQTSSNVWPQSAVFQINKNGIPLSKIVIGKPTAGDASNGYIDPNTLAGCVGQAKNQGWILARLTELAPVKK
ncbi:hypothetical protein DXG03_006806, partial [Asterophora parasitica]